MFDFQQLKQQQVRDLAICCFSEPLIKNFDPINPGDVPGPCSLELNDQRIAWLRSLDQNPKLLLHYLDQIQPRRLGQYNEALWHFFLQQDDEVELVARNHQLRQNGRSIGEFDVIYRNKKTAKHVHLELAFKLYLQATVAPHNPLDQWLGPNVKDRLDSKLSHMLNHQSQLSRYEAGRQQLLSLGIDKIDREISLRGYLLNPRQQIPHHSIPDPLNPKLLSGEWQTVSKIHPLLDRHEHWIALSRLNWVSPLSVYSGETYNPDDFRTFLRRHFAQSNTAIMIAALENQQTEHLTERFRVMLTPDCWPNC